MVSLKRTKTSIIFSIMITLISVVAVTSCDNNRDEPKESSLSEISTDSGEQITENLKFKSLLSDPHFENGFTIKGLGGEDGVGVKGYFPLGCNESGQRIYWNLAQWSARYSFTDAAVSSQSTLSEGVHKIQSPTEMFVADTNTGQLTFNCTTSKCYDTPRTGSEGWLHQLIETNLIAEDEWNKVTALKQLNISMDTQLTKFEDHMGDAFNGSIHAAQFLMYIVVQNKNQESPDYHKYIWFGIGMFDNRNEKIAGGAMWDNGTSAMMYGLSSKDTLVGDYHYVKDNTIQAGAETPWVSYRVDVMKHVEAALKITQYKGYLRDTTMDDLYFTGMNLGWELPGTYDVEMLLKNFDIVAARKSAG